MNFISLWSIPPLVSSILFLFIGFFVYKKNRKSTLNILFFAFGAMTFIWQFAMFLLFNTVSPDIANIFVRVAHIGIIFLPVTVYHFTVVLAGLKRKFDHFFIALSYLMSVVFELLLFTNLLVNDHYIYFWGFYPKAGIIHPIYLIVLSVSVFRIFYCLSIAQHKHKKLSDLKYYQLKYFTWASMFYVIAAVDFLLNYGVEFYPIGFLFILIFLGITSYAIIKHRLMDIKVVLRHYTVYFLSFSVVALLTILLFYFIDTTSRYFLFYNTLIIFLLLIIFPYIKNYFFRLANKYFFTSLYNSNEVISNLNSKLRSTLELDYIHEVIFDAIESSFHVKASAFLIYDSLENQYQFKYRRGEFKKALKTWQGNLTLHQYYTKKNKVIFVDELEERNDLESQEMAKYFKAQKVVLLAPVNIKWRNVGLLALGEKESGDAYSTEDIDLLEIISGFGATAIENGSLYNDINKKNEKLERLLAVKTDFLRIANHQLNTPLSIMRLAYSSVEEDGIPIEDGFRIAKAGVERLSEVISQLWTVAALEAGDLQMHKNEFDLWKTCREVINAKLIIKEIIEKNLEFILDPPKNSKKYLVWADELRIREVISRLLDNSIAYTKEGSVKIVLEETKENIKSFIKVSIIDTGVGISKEDQANIFDKFFRSKTAVLLHPDGSGVGLYTAKHIIEACGGAFILESSSSKGTVFSFTLPFST